LLIYRFAFALPLSLGNGVMLHKSNSLSHFPPLAVPALSAKKIRSIVCGDHLTVILSGTSVPLSFSGVSH